METSSHFFILLAFVAASFAGSLNEKFLLIDKNVKLARSISHCTKEAVRALFYPSNDVSIIIPNRTVHADLVQGSLEEIFANRIVKIFPKFPNHSNDESRFLIRESSFVLIEHNVSLRQLLEDSSVKRWAEYIIVTEATIQWLSEFADYLWNLGFVKVAFVRVASIGKSTLHRLIRDPSSRDSPPTLVTYDLCNKSSASGPFEKNEKASIIVHSFSSLFQTPANATLRFVRLLEGTEEQRDFSKYTSNDTRTNAGIDVMQIFATKHNIELIKYGWKNQNESTWTDAMNRCLAGEFDFFYAVQPPSINSYKGWVDAVTWFKFETLGFVDRRLKNSFHPFSEFFLPYRGTVWICTVAIFATFVLFAYATQALWRQGLVRERIPVLHFWSIFVAQSLPTLPIKYSLRFVIGMWILHSLNANLLYTSIFSSALTAPDSSNLLRTFQDVRDSGRRICGGETDKELLNDRNNSHIRGIHNRFELIAPKHAFSKINEGYICSRHVSYVREYNWINRGNDSLQVYSLAEAVIVRYPKLYFAKRHHPYSEAFNRVVSILRDTGVISYLIVKYAKNVRNAKDEMAQYTSDEKFLNLNHLRIVFYALVVCHLISGLVLLIELYMHKRSVNQRNRRNL